MAYLRSQLLLTAVGMVLLVACGPLVDVTKTAKGFREPTNANDVDIIRTRPQREFEELGTVTAIGFDLDESAKMHNALRSKSAPLGAHAVLLIEEGVLRDGWGNMKRWATGIAIRYR